MQLKQHTDLIESVEIEAVFFKVVQVIFWRELENEEVLLRGLV